MTGCSVGRGGLDSTAVHVPQSALMKTRTATLLNHILSKVEQARSDLVRGWFADLSIANIGGGVVRIQSRNQAQVDYLKRHCHAVFLEAAQAVTGRLVSTVFELASLPDDEGAGQFAPNTSPFDEPTPDLGQTFEQFVDGPSSRLAVASAQAVASDPGQTYSPLFIHGPEGVGKTHLLQSIYHQLRSGAPTCALRYVTGEAFISEMITAIETARLPQFQVGYRHLEVFLLDGVQHFSHRHRSQDELFHIFNAVLQSKGQIVLSADCPPEDLSGMADRLISRFRGGLVARIDEPCLETRMAIVRSKAKLHCIDVPDEVVHLLATRFGTNARELEQSLARLDALSQKEARPIDLALAHEVLSVTPTRPVPISTILDVTAKRFDLGIGDLMGRTRSQAVSFPRQVCMYLARELTTHSLEGIGRRFSGRDQTTILHGARTVARQAQADPQVRKLLDELASEVKNAVC